MSTEFCNVVQFLDIHYPNTTFCAWGSVNTGDSLTKAILSQENIQVPAQIHTANSKLGDVDFRVFYPYPTDYRSDSVGNDIEMEQHIQMPMKHIVDGILFRGSWEEQNRLAPRPDHIYADMIYLNELIRREKMVNIPPYRTRLYFYKLFESKDFIPFENALTGTDMNAIDSLFHPLKALIPEDKIMDVLICTGQFYLGKKEILKSIAVFKLASGVYPDHFLPLVSLGDAYLANSELEMAEKYYQEALLRNPESNFIKIKIEKLKNK